METTHQLTIFNFRHLIFIIALIICLFPFTDPSLALLLGFIIAQTSGNPFTALNHKWTQFLLKISVVGLGFGMNLHQAMKVGAEGLGFTVFSIFMTLAVGIFLGKRLKVENKLSFLIACGTAICGGSAIAAISPLIKVGDKQISTALGVIFILNAVALFLFPLIGHFLHLNQHEFGLWCAMAIHDTSSVVGAASKFGQEALQIATTVKLERALWIIPLSLLSTIFYKGDGSKIQIPWFILFFLAAMLLNTYLHDFGRIFQHLVHFARQGLAVTLFLIGTGLNFGTIRSVGARPFLQGALLWIFISLISLLVILF